jgi:hypothetical protein
MIAVGPVMDRTPRRMVGLVLALGLLAAPVAEAVLPEPGIYIPSSTGPTGDPAKLSYVEVQQHRVYVLLVAFNSESGEPELFEASAPLRDDLMVAGSLDPPQIREGYYPLHAATTDLVSVRGGRCLTCSESATEWSRTPVGQVQIYFPYAGTVSVELTINPDIVLPPGVLRFRSTSYHRIAFGRERIINGSGGPGVHIPFVHADLRGQWVFVDQGDAGGPVRDEVVRAEFTERDFNPDPSTPEPHIHYRDPQRGIEFRCTSIGTMVGGKAAGCELHRAGIVLFSARREDLGMDRIQAMRGELPRIVALVPTVTDPYRKPGQVIGLRVSMPPPGPLVPEPPDPLRDPVASTAPVGAASASPATSRTTAPGPSSKAR